jgi:hypothetical protein
MVLSNLGTTFSPIFRGETALQRGKRVGEA